MITLSKFTHELSELEKALKKCRNVLITAPAAADGDSIGSQLALREMILECYPHAHVYIVNDEPLPPRYSFLPDVESVYTPETFSALGIPQLFDVAIIVDGGIDRAGKVQDWFAKCPVQIFIDHHAISIDYPYTIRIVEPAASATTELIYQLSRSSVFGNPITPTFAQQVYLGLVFDTGFFRHSNTTPEVMELAASLLRRGFDFTRVGERGMLEKSFDGLKLFSDTISRAELRSNNKIIWSVLTQEMLKRHRAIEDDREGIIDSLLLTRGIEVAVLFIELANSGTKVSFRSHGFVDVAAFARSLTVHGGGHTKAAGATLEAPMNEVIPGVLDKLHQLLGAVEKKP